MDKGGYLLWHRQEIFLIGLCVLSSYTVLGDCRIFRIWAFTGGNRLLGPYFISAPILS